VPAVPTPPTQAPPETLLNPRRGSLPNPADPTPPCLPPTVWHITWAHPQSSTPLVVDERTRSTPDPAMTVGSVSLWLGQPWIRVGGRWNRTRARGWWTVSRRTTTRSYGFSDPRCCICIPLVFDVRYSGSYSASPGPAAMVWRSSVGASDGGPPVAVRPREGAQVCW